MDKTSHPHFCITIIIGLFLILGPFRVYGQGELSSKNFANTYRLKNEINLKSQAVVQSDSVLLLFLNLQINHNRTKLSDLEVSYTYFNRYNEDNIVISDTLNLPDYRQATIANKHFFKVSLTNPKDKKFMIIRIKNQATETELFFDIPIIQKNDMLSSGIVLMNHDSLPLFRSYVRKKENARLSNLKSPIDIITLYRYQDDFPIGRPPFDTNPNQTSRDLKILDKYTLEIGILSDQLEPGLYFAQNDTTGVNGLAFRLENDAFPRQADYGELVECLTYFCTTSELQVLNTSENKKQAFDEFWLKISPTTEKAKKTIRNYYRKIAEANQLFTTYKQGWKTDKGMIYVIFGPPNEVKKDGRAEEWVYYRNSELPRVSFEFRRMSSFFTYDHYNLIRKKGYQEVWYKAIDLWRKGLKDI